MRLGLNPSVCPMQTAEFILSGALGAGFVVSLAVIRIYLGWSYVGDRLLSAAVAYEETGWWLSCIPTPDVIVLPGAAPCLPCPIMS